MKKFGLLYALIAALAVISIEAHKCHIDLKGLSGVALLDASNANYLLTTYPGVIPNDGTGPQIGFTPTMSIVSGCGFTVNPVCLTVRNESIAALAANIAFQYFIEVILQFDVLFDKPFKNRPVVTATLDLLNASQGNGLCPLEGDGETFPPFLGYAGGYINDVTVSVNSVTNAGFRAVLSLKLFLPAATTPVPANYAQLIVAGLIQQCPAIDFIAVCAPTVAVNPCPPSAVEPAVAEKAAKEAKEDKKS